MGQAGANLTDPLKLMLPLVEHLKHPVTPKPPYTDGDYILGFHYRCAGAEFWDTKDYITTVVSSKGEAMAKYLYRECLSDGDSNCVFSLCVKLLTSLAQFCVFRCCHRDWVVRAGETDLSTKLSYRSHPPQCALLPIFFKSNFKN